MTTAREAFEAKKLEQKYGVVGKVAARYRRAGYQVRVESTDEDSPLHFTAAKTGSKLAVKVYWKTGRVPVEALEAVAGEASKRGFKPILVLYGAGPKVSGEVLEKAKSLGVSIRRVRV